jgi:UDPglucose 6-dehydrogenase
LPTPFFEDILKIDLSIYNEALAEICPKVAGTGKILVIKSTVAPGTTRDYAELYPDVHFCFNPEFLTEANYLFDFVNTERIIVGAENDWVSQSVIMLYRSMPHFRETTILQMSTTAAEIVKYQCNAILATRVAVSNVFYDICQEEGVSYEDVKKGVELDERIGSSHISVTSERGFGGKCFPKDLGAVIGKSKEIGVDCKLLEEVYEYNNRIRKVKDWHEIAGATAGGRDYRKEPTEPTALFFRAKKIDGQDQNGNSGGDYFKDK